jgi:endonuclease/exonuclease/phosphatase family metal-dependent hydrolase
MLDGQPWIIVGGFNLIRRPENRNKPGRDPNMMMVFNEAISKLGIIELPLSGQQYTWSNMQQNPLLERLDWFFISQAWSLKFPGTLAKTLTRDLSDHVPCSIHIKTAVPRPRIFWFENFWMEHKDFKDTFK